MQATRVQLWLTISAYLLLNSSLNLCNRYTLGYAGFRFPVLLTCSHLTFQILSLSQLLGGNVRGHVQTYSKSWRSLSAVGIFLSCNIALNNASLLHLSLPINQVIRSTIPVICAICAIFVENKYPTPLQAVGLCLVVVGVMMTIVGTQGSADQKTSNTTGVIFCCLATLSNALMMTFSGYIMGNHKLSALETAYYTSFAALGCLVPIGLLMERSAFSLFEGSGKEYVNNRWLAFLVIFGCCNAVLYNWIHNKVIALTSATTTTVLGNVKIVALVLSSRVMFGETRGWTDSMIVGGLLAFTGFALYSAKSLR